MIHLIQVDRDGLMSFACTNVERYQHKEGAMTGVFSFMIVNAMNYCPACRAALDARWEKIAKVVQ